MALGVRIIGAGRAGRSLHRALEGAGWPAHPIVGRGDDLSSVARDPQIDVVVVATPDAVIGDVARALPASDRTVVMHLSGSLGLDALAPHPRRAAMHPLVSMPDPVIGAERLGAGAWFAVAGDEVAVQMVDALRGRSIEIDDADRARYHAAACVASNHVVTLLAQVERLASSVGVPLEAFLDLARGSVDNVAEVGPRRALTGPAVRGDRETIERHRRAIPTDELALYDALVVAARHLATDAVPGSERS